MADSASNNVAYRRPAATMALGWSKGAYRSLAVAGLPLSTAISYVLLFAAAFLVYRATWSGAPFMAPDSQSYLNTAHDLSDFRPDVLNLRPPGYPLLLVLTGSSNGATRLLFHTSLALHFASIWIIAAVLHTLGLKGKWLFALAALLLLPPYVEYSAYLLSETLSQFLLVVTFGSVAFWFLQRRATGLAVLAGLAIACSALTRPTYQLLAPAVVGLVLFYYKAIRHTSLNLRSCITAALIWLGASTALIGGFSTVNYAKFGFFGVYPMSGLNLSTRTVGVLERLPDQYAGEREALIKARAAALAKGGDAQNAYLSYWQAIPDLKRVTGLKRLPELSSHLSRLHLALIREAPLYYLREVVSSFAGLWLPSATPVANMGSRTLQVLWVVLQLSVLVLFVLQLVVIAGLAILNCSERWLVKGPDSDWTARLVPHHLFVYCLAGTIVFYNAFVTSLVEVGDPRYRMPAEPFVIGMCFLGFHMWREILRHRASAGDLQTVTAASSNVP
jgi:hypothetical protein